MIEGVRNFVPRIDKPRDCQTAGWRSYGNAGVLYLPKSEEPVSVALTSPNRQPVGAVWRLRGGATRLDSAQGYAARWSHETGVRDEH